jgi:hypothetical protein
MARPGDEPIIMLPDPNFTPSPTPEIVMTPEVVSNWQVWGLLFFSQ